MRREDQKHLTGLDALAVVLDEVFSPIGKELSRVQNSWNKDVKQQVYNFLGIPYKVFSSETCQSYIGEKFYQISIDWKKLF